MKKSVILIAFAFILFSTWTYSQITQKSDTIFNFEKAYLLNGDVTKIIQRTMKYPMQAIQNKVQGDVILSLVINRNGKLEGLSIVSSPDMSLST
ncbi:MAG: TonB family protein, partial [Bacteroidales bacterium]|nr:TonB family protein [Bacteroidales bacterium]